jgi:hypothetical protein
MKKPDAKKSGARQSQPFEELISKRIAALGDWRGDALGRMRTLIKAADPDVVEEWKWDVPVWSHDGIICTGESYKKAVKLTFAKGASLKDPARLFNSSLEGKVRRAIDIHEGEKVDASAFKALFREAVALNSSGKLKPSKKANPRVTASKRPATIAEYIRAAPREGQPHLRRLYAILKSVAPEAEEAIKWGNPFFVEPRFLFAFSAHKAHVSFAPMAAALEAFRQELESHKTTRNFLQIPYTQPLPEDLVRRIAEYCLRKVGEREDDAFW